MFKWIEESVPDENVKGLYDYKYTCPECGYEIHELFRWELPYGCPKCHKLLRW